MVERIVNRHNSLSALAKSTILMIACLSTGGLRNDGVGGDSRLGKRFRRGVRQEQYKRQ